MKYVQETAFEKYMEIFRNLRALYAKVCVLLLKIFSRLRYLKEAKNVRSLWVAYFYLRSCTKWKDDNRFDVIAENKEIDDPNVIWIYWRQGYDQAPPLVQKCIMSARQYAGKYRVVLLDETNRKDYVRFPDYIERKHDEQIIKEALFSDLLRISLLIHYGGIWCDATCLWTAELPEIIENSDFFMFSESQMMANITPIVGSNWLIKAEKSNVILIKTRNCLFNYWYRHNFLPHYFIFHLVLSLLVKEDEEAKKVWNSMPYICNMNPHVMQFSFHKPYTKSSFESIVAQCFVHKLTYKFDPSILENDIDGKTVLHYILEEI